MARIEDLFSLSEIQSYVQQRNYQPTLGEGLFPNVKDDVVDISYILGANSLPVSASVRAVDAETQIASRQAGGEVFSHEIFVIARKIPLTERYILELARTTDSAVLNSYKRELFNDVDRMVESVRVRIEAMRMEALFNGMLEINENGYVGTVDYQVPAEHQIELTGTDVWGGSTSDWIANIDAWTALLAEKGVTATRILTSSAVLRTLTGSAITRQYMGLGDAQYVSVPSLNAWLTSQGLPTFAVYDQVYGIEKNDGTVETHRYVPEGKIVLFGSQPVGVTQFGITAEEVELRIDAGKTVQNFGNIVAVIEREGDPPTRWTKAVARALPSFTAAQQVIQATVLAPSP